MQEDNLLLPDTGNIRSSEEYPVELMIKVVDLIT